MSTAAANALQQSSSAWHNWSGNLSYTPPQGSQFLFMPSNAQELSAVLAQAVAAGKQVRVSGQRHSQPPLVADASSQSANTLFLIDMSCYADLGPGGNLRMIVQGNTVTVNTGVREDELDAFLGQNQLMLQTVTAGGFFCVGGMTAVDVHGATVQAPIFAETAIAFTIMGADGSVTTIDANTAPVNGWSPLQFARVSLGMLGVVTSVTLVVLPRPYANSLTGGIADGNWTTQDAFVQGLGALLQQKTRVEAFFNPYADGIFFYPFTACWWNVQTGSGAPYTPPSVENACQLAGQGEYGASYLKPPAKEAAGEIAAFAAQEASDNILASVINGTAVTVIKGDVNAANAQFSELWLSQAARATFMSYFIELPDLQAAGLGIVWQALQNVKNLVTQTGSFHLAAPMEFRFVRGGNSALAGTYTSNVTGSPFVNLDLIAFVPTDAAGTGLVYPDPMLQLFAAVERQWVALGGWPHNGKMYGFYDPNGAPGNYIQPFNPAFITAVRQRRAARVQAFNAYRQQRDPKGVFLNQYVDLVVGA
jgi:hypothetical protein